jgi:PDZ domain-containing protein
VRLPSVVHRWWAVPAAALSILMSVAVGIAAVLPAELVAEQQNARIGELQPAPYARVPSSAQPVDQRVRFGDLEGAAEVFESPSAVYFVTVTELRQSVLSWWVGRDQPAVEFLTAEQRYGLQTPEQRRVFALESMRSSEQVAQFVALQALGYNVEIVPGDVLIQQLVCLEFSDDGRECVRFSPSSEVLEPGDRLLTADGVELDGVEDLTRALQGKSPGDVIEITLERPRVGALTVMVELTSSPTDPERTIVGFVPFDTRRVVLPFELDIDTGRIGGPSAGLAFTLTLLEALTPGNLAGGTNIAVTGTIELDGSVGAVGGLRQKASAVAQAGIEVFLVPAAQGEADIEAARRAGGESLQIFPVASLDEALAVLEGLGGDPIVIETTRD